jgi:NAD(P)H-dependent FMN reductase
LGQYSKPHTKAWAAKVGSFDGSLRHARIQSWRAQRSKTRLIFCSSGTTRPLATSATAAPAARAVEQLRLVLAEVQMATVRNQVCPPCLPTLKTGVFGQMSGGGVGECWPGYRRAAHEGAAGK